MGRRGFTLIELMVVMAVGAILVTLAAPSLYDFILKQRLKAVSAQLVNDLQFARSEAAARNQFVRVSLSNTDSLTCYVLFTGAGDNDCGCDRSTICGPAGVEIRTVQVPRSLQVLLLTTQEPPIFRFDPSNGAMVTGSLDLTGAPAQQFVIDASIDTPRTLRTEVRLSGRPNVCAPSGSTMSVATC
ncbi:MAG: GspH/FimT family pseudopilin [Chitinophagaceae bacterium]|nr:GspH/FimT family pseudopilin [Rubrivivax sp.]